MRWLFGVMSAFLIFVFSLQGSDGVTLGSESATGAMRRIAKTYRESPIGYLPEQYRYIEDLEKNIQEKRPILTITYLTSSSVPLSAHIHFSKAIRKLEESFRIQGKMCMQGIEAKGFGSFVSKLMTRLFEEGDDELGLDFCPDLFNDFNVSTAPAVVISVCENSYKHIEECPAKYIIRGDVSLKFMMEKLADINPYFKDMYEAL